MKFLTVRVIDAESKTDLTFKNVTKIEPDNFYIILHFSGLQGINTTTISSPNAKLEAVLQDEYIEENWQYR